MSSTIYVITYHTFSHNGITHEGKPRKSLDARFLSSHLPYVYYLIDDQIPEVLKGKKTLLENSLDPLLHNAGKNYLGEWSFLLAEAKHGFCDYPFFMISSRFYEKNQWLYSSLDVEWKDLFGFFNHYDFGYLPSYDRALHWLDLRWEKKVEREAWRYQFFPFTPKIYQTLDRLYDIKIGTEYRRTADLLCNYIGFKTREQLLDYVDFYLPLIHTFFDKEFHPKHDLSTYVRKTGHYLNEKPFTFILEWFSHLFFYKRSLPFFALHYDGYYEIDERASKMKKLTSFSLTPSLRLRRFCDSKWREWKNEGFLAPLRPYAKALKTKVTNGS